MTRDTDPDVRARFEAAGVSNVSSPTPADVRRWFVESLRGSLDADLVATFIRQAAIAPNLCLASLRDAASSSADVSAKTIDIIQRSLPLLEAALAAADTPLEREKVIERVLSVVREARAEAKEHRALLTRVVVSAASVAVVAVGALAVVMSQGRSKGVLHAGEKLLRGG